MVFFSILLACTSSEKVITTVNDIPEAIITSHQDGAEILENMPIVLMGTIFDSNDSYDQLAATWYAGTDVLCAETTPESDGSSSCAANIVLGVEMITLSARDPSNARYDAVINVSILETEPPSAAILSPLSGEMYYTDQLIAFEGMVSDLEDDPEDLSIRWVSSLDGELSSVNVVPNADGDIFGYGNLTEGEHILELIVEDSAGKLAVDNIILSVNGANSVPSCEITAPSTGSAGQEGALVTFFGSATDPDISSSALEVVWSSDKDGDLSSSNPNGAGTVSFAYDGLSLNTHVITMTATDEVGEECVADIIYTVGSPPSLVLSSPSNSLQVNEGDSVSFVAEVSDSEDSAADISLSWSSSIDGIFSTTQANSNGVAQFYTSDLSSGTHDITVTATDSGGLYVDQIVQITVNGIPSQASLVLNPDPAYSDDDLVAIASGSVDPEGSVVSYLYDWYSNGVSSGQISSALSASLTTKGETWMVRVTPSDGLSTGAFVEASIVIQNSAPEMQAVSLSPNPASTQDDLICSYSVVDVDGDSVSVSFQWTMAGNTLSSTTDTLTGPFQQGDTITCQVTPSDGTASGASMDSTISITNTAPIVNTVALSPSLVLTNDILTATLSATDADGDTLSYSWDWYVDSGSGAQLVLSNSGTSSVDSLDGVFYFEKMDSVYVSATASDGSVSHSLTSSMLVIANTPPSAFNVVITPIEPVAGVDDLLCIVQGSDVDGDLITFSYAWMVDGASSSYSTDSISTVDIANDEVWECIVTPNDGTVDGTSNSTSVTIGANIEGAVGSAICASAGSNSDSSGNQNLSCLSETGVAGEESTDSSSNTWQPGSIYVFSPE